MNERTLLLRQVHPSWVQAGKVTSQAFRPTPKDRKQLSVYDGDQITAGDSWRHFTTTLHFESAGVLALEVADCDRLGLAVRPDPEPFPEHMLIDFSAYGEGEIVRKGKQLKMLAEARGWQFRADE